MVYITVNSKVNINPNTKLFVENVVSYADKDVVKRAKDDSFYMRSKAIPILLVNEDKFKEYSNVKYDPDESNIKPDTEWLGIYTRVSNDLFSNTPVILVCPERIVKCIDFNEEFDFLFTKVVLHELAHAIMDSKNQNAKYKAKDEFFTYMEESMANKLTLEGLNNFKKYYNAMQNTNPAYQQHNLGDKLFKFAKDFIKKQPPAYALGFEIFNNDLGNWELWKDKKGMLLDEDDLKKKWLSSAKTVEIEYMRFYYDYLFLGEKQAFVNKLKRKYNKDTIKEVLYLLREKMHDENTNELERVEITKDLHLIVKHTKEKMEEFLKEVNESENC